MTTIQYIGETTKGGLFSLQGEEEGARGNGLLGALGVGRAAAVRVLIVVRHRVLASLEDVKLAIRLTSESPAPISTSTRKGTRRVDRRGAAWWTRGRRP